MKKYIILSAIALIACLTSKSQTLEQNLKKYWYFRERLKNDFMVVDNNNAQVTNIPASSRSKFNLNSIAFAFIFYYM
jgi:hypothetical protein